jgi:hypothetical protein
MTTPPVVPEDTSEGIPRIVQLGMFGLIVAIGAYLAYRDWHLLFPGIGCLFVGLGIFTIVYMTRAVTRARRSVTWPTAEAVVVRSEVVTDTTTSGTGGSVGRTMTTYDPEVSFEYEVAGRRYRSSRIIFVDINYRYDDAKATVDRYHVGSRVAARYDPRNPKVAVLEPGMAGNAGHYYLGFGIGLGFALLGLLFAYAIPWLASGW